MGRLKKSKGTINIKCRKIVVTSGGKGEGVVRKGYTQNFQGACKVLQVAT